MFGSWSVLREAGCVDAIVLSDASLRGGAELLRLFRPNGNTATVKLPCARLQLTRRRARDRHSLRSSNGTTFDHEASAPSCLHEAMSFCQEWSKSRMAEAEARMRPPCASLRKKRSTCALRRNGPCSHHLIDYRPKSTNRLLEDSRRLQLQQAQGAGSQQPPIDWGRPEQLRGSFRVQNAAMSLDGQPREAGFVSCGPIYRRHFQRAPTTYRNRHLVCLACSLGSARGNRPSQPPSCCASATLAPCSTLIRAQ